MKQRLPQNSISLIHDSLKDDVVLRAVDTSCKQFESRMNVMRFSTTENYIESVSLLDEIRRQSYDFDFQNVYDNLLCRLRNYDKSNENVDAILAASVIIVFTAYIIFICNSVNDHYKYWALNLLKTVPKEADHKNVLKLIASRLPDRLQDELKDCMCSYINQSGKWLSKQVEDIIRYNGMDAELINALMPHFYSVNQLANVIAYLKEIKASNGNPAVTRITVQYIKDKKISNYNNSHKRPLWQILHTHGLYKAGIDNWNKAVNV